MALPNLNQFPNIFSKFGGIEIVEDLSLAEEWNQCIHLTWKQRLLSWPWRPWVKERVEVVSLPAEYVLKMGHIFVCHPEMAVRIRNAGK